MEKKVWPNTWYRQQLWIIRGNEPLGKGNSWTSIIPQSDSSLLSTIKSYMKQRVKYASETKLDSDTKHFDIFRPIIANIVTHLLSFRPYNQLPFIEFHHRLPFISTLELRQFNGSIYLPPFENQLFLIYFARIKFGRVNEQWKQQITSPMWLPGPKKLHPKYQSISGKTNSHLRKWCR